MNIKSVSRNLSVVSGAYTLPDSDKYIIVVGEASVATAQMYALAHPNRFFALARAEVGTDWLIVLPNSNVNEFFYSIDEKLLVDTGGIFIDNIEKVGHQEIL